jgi:protein involved in polysaccharide export with SLBB domain
MMTVKATTVANGIATSTPDVQMQASLGSLEGRSCVHLTSWPRILTPARRISRSTFRGAGLLAASAVLVLGVAMEDARAQSPNEETVVLRAHPASQTMEIPAAEPAEKPASDIYTLATGDRLKISVYGREDLTGEYRVQDDGQVRVPTLGEFRATGQTAPKLADGIRAAMEQMLQRQSTVIIDVIERRPVVVAGLVSKPGAYPFSPGMTVIHATALAGGTMFAPATLPTEALREGARLVASKEELKRLLARQARLRAEKADLNEITASSELIEAVGQDEAAQLVKEEQALHERQLAAFARQRAALHTAILEGEKEVAAYDREISHIAEQRKIRETNLATIQSLSQRGLTTQQRLTDAELLLANVDRDAQAAIANSARSKQNLARNERDLELLAMDSKIRTDKEMQTVGEQIAKANAAMEGSAKIIHHAAGVPALLLTQDRELRFRYEILRKDSQGSLASIPATDTTVLLPGDVLRVTAMTAR